MVTCIIKYYLIDAMKEGAHWEKVDSGEAEGVRKASSGGKQPLRSLPALESFWEHSKYSEFCCEP